MTDLRLARLDAGELIRFGLVGAVNTVVGLSVILAGLALGLGDVSANVSGYAVGLATSFVFNRRWTFRHQGRVDGPLLGRYLLAFLTAYIANLSVVLSLIHAGLVARPLAHILAAGVYTGIFYVLCRYAVFSRPDADRKVSADISRPTDGFALALIGGAALLFWFLRDIPLGHDQSWYLLAAHKILAGARPYLDLVEINPPLAFYMVVPPVFIAERLELSPDHVFIAYVVALALVSTLWARWHLLKISGQRGAHANVATAVALLLTTAFTARDFGQRDGLMMIFAMPYFALALRRLNDDQIGRKEAFAVGLWAAIGFCLKPYFLVVPAATELVLLANRQRRIRPELVAIAAACAVYLIAIITLFPTYLETIVPMARATYFAYQTRHPFSWSEPLIICLGVALLVYVPLRRQAQIPCRLDLLAGWSVAALISYVVQDKGFSYQAEPLGIMLMLLAAQMITEKVRTHSIVTVFGRIASGSILCFIAFQVYAIGLYVNHWPRDVGPYITKYGAPDGLYTFTAHVFIGFPMANRYGPWDSRFPALWPIPGAARILARPQDYSPARVEAAKAADRYVTQAVVEDFERRMPSIVIVDAHKDKSYFDGVPFNYVDYFSRDPTFAGLWRNYTLAGTVNDYEIWRKVTPALKTP